MSTVLRRVRGVVVSALIWGTLMALGSAVVVSLTLLFKPQTRAEIPSLIADLIPSAFWYGAAIGALFAATLAVLGRNQSLATMSKSSFRAALAIAGMVTGVAAQYYAHDMSFHGPIRPFVEAVLFGAYTGWAGGPAILYVVQRASAKEKQLVA